MDSMGETVDLRYGGASSIRAQEVLFKSPLKTGITRARRRNWEDSITRCLHYLSSGTGLFEGGHKLVYSICSEL